MMEKDGFAGQSEPQRATTQKVTVSQDIRLSRTTTFTTEPKTHRIRRGKTIVIRRCQDIMRHLWDMGLKHNAKVTVQPIENAVFYCAGGDYRTIKKYIGFDITLGKSGQLKHISGYLERLHYVDRVGNGFYALRHAVVPLNYHYEERLENFGVSECVNEESSQPIDVLCVSGEGEGVSRSNDEIGAMAPIITNKTNKHNTHTQIIPK